MTKRADVRASPAGPGMPITGPPLGVYQPGFQYREASLAFFRQCVGDETYDRAMGSEVGRRHHYVAARLFLDQKDWEKFVWIEQYGSLAGFPERG